MKKNAFTLIELLAVIVILAIIALIATPIILGIIKDAKEQSTKNSAHNYLDTVEQAIIRKNLKEKFSPTRCEITGNELDCDGYDEKIKIEVDGDTSIKGIILFENNMITQGTNFILNDYIVKINEEDELTIKPIPAPKSFNEDSWETIIANVRKGNIDVYKSNLENDENNTKQITLTSNDAEIAGTYTVRIANTQIPDECSTEGFSQTACGFVIEFQDIITEAPMNKSDPVNTNVGGYPATSMHIFVNDEIYKSFPEDLKNIIINTTVISSPGSTSGETNFKTKDKVYLLSAEEVYGLKENEISRDQTRQLDYYNEKEVTQTNYSEAKKVYNGNRKGWWLRSADPLTTSNFYDVSLRGEWGRSNAGTLNGVAPAFRIG